MLVVLDYEYNLQMQDMKHYCKEVMLNKFEYSHTHTHTRLTALFRDYPGEPVPER